MGDAVHGDGALLHRLQQRALRLGRGAVDLVGEYQVREDRAGLVMEFAAAVLVADDVGPHDVGGHQVRCELDASETHRQGLAKRANEHGLAKAGDAFEQDVASGRQCDDGIAEEGFLADNQAGQLVLERLRQLGHPGCVDARFFGDHDPPWRDLPGGTRFTELREVLPDEVALTSGDEALLRRIERRLLVGLDHLGVRAQRHVLSRTERRRVIL